MGLATPTAITVGMGRATHLGFLIRRGEVFEILSKLSLVIFDKTGTLTEGNPSVTYLYAKGVDGDEFLRLAASVEQHSEHPLAEAIVKAARERGLELYPCRSFDYREGAWVSGDVMGMRVFVGRPDHLFDDLHHDLDRIKKRLEREGIITVGVKCDRGYGIIGVSDRLREGAKETVEAIRKLGIKVAILTGDNESAARRVGKLLGINLVVSNVMPHEKADKIRHLKSGGEVVCFVGDGINDAPSLIVSDVGIAMGTGTDIAKESGDVILMRNDLKGVYTVIDFGRRVMRKIKFNLFWAVVYNALLIPMAAGLFEPLLGFSFRPELSGLAMTFSSVSVVLSSITLKRYRPEVSLL